MDNLSIFQKLKTYEYLNGESTNQLLAQPIEVVTNDQLVEIIAKKLENNADMLPKYDKIFDFDHVRLLLIVLFFDVT